MWRQIAVTVRKGEISKKVVVYLLLEQVKRCQVSVISGARPALYIVTVTKLVRMYTRSFTASTDGRKSSQGRRSTSPLEEKPINEIKTIRGPTSKEDIFDVCRLKRIYTSD